MENAARQQIPEAWKSAIAAALSANPSLETWQGHFHHRIPEFEEILQYWPGRRLESALEIGCGNGLAAVYFSPLVERIVASDLPNVDSQAHSIGLDFARSFFKCMRLDHVQALGCSAESIPLPDKSFDLVYGIYCLEHVPNRAAALRETLRVLRGGGEALFTVPGAAWALQFPLGFYNELAQRIWGRLKKRLAPSKPGSEMARPGETAPVKVTGAASFFKYYPHFPFPEPHGAHASWPAEIVYYRKSSWEKLVQAAGFRHVEVMPINFVPKFMRSFLPSFLVEKLEAFFRRRPALHRFAQFFCIRAIAP